MVGGADGFRGQSRFPSAGRSALIADEYALLYQAPRTAVERAALLRAEAAAMRDAQAQQPDWDAIGRPARSRTAISPAKPSISRIA